MGQKNRHVLRVMKAFLRARRLLLLGQTGVEGDVEGGSLLMNYTSYQLIEFTTYEEL